MNWQSFLSGIVIGAAAPAILTIAIEYRDWFRLYRKNMNNTWYQAAGKAFKQINIF